MKTIFKLMVLMITITSCEPWSDPQASFSVSNDYVLTGENVYFYNNSNDATEYEWDFGDGTYTNDFEPIHYFSSPGNYQVRLSAYNHDRVSDSYITVQVVDPAEMKITVWEYGTNYVIPNATVQVYPSFTDWKNETNLITTGITNSYGIVYFDQMFPGYYYLYISARNYNNYDLGLTSNNYIITPELYSGYLTSFDAFVEYTGSSSKTMVTKSISTSNLEVSNKVERTKIQKTK
jgi:PKD repeat protein